MLTITFMTTLGRNVGDEFIREGIRAILDNAGVAYTPLYVNKHDPLSIREPREDEMRIVSDKFWDCDVFIQAGAPVYWRLNNGVHNSLNSEWSDWLWNQRILNPDRQGPLFLNLGAGSCQPLGDDASTFLADPACADFARRAAVRAALTTVRDPLASDILTALNISHEALPCPAFLAAARHRFTANSTHTLGLNLMPIGGHYDLRGDFDSGRWIAACRNLCDALRPVATLVFIAHDRAEHAFMASFARPDERLFLGAGWRDYLDIYSNCTVVAANRVHGAVCAAGFGVPALIIGNDTRAHIGDYIGIPIHESNSMQPEAIISALHQLLRDRPAISAKLIDHRDATLQRYVALLRAALARALPAPLIS